MPSPTSWLRSHVGVAGVLLAFTVLLGLYAWQVKVASWEVAAMQWLQESGPPGLREVSIGLTVAGNGVPWAALIALLAGGGGG